MSVSRTACFLSTLGVEDPANGKQFWFGSFEEGSLALTIISQTLYFQCFNRTLGWILKDCREFMQYNAMQCIVLYCSRNGRETIREKRNHAKNVKAGQVLAKFEIEVVGVGSSA
jgi:hypothetical protein